ncbi:hypothetical protein CH289_20160 [Rhodococcus sp. RS1C4]|jgi:hypothetical protein|uniref:hypothetical protein n=1 Tax=Nocardiaceae TaxID=85025 RepID=UPI0003624EDB|nr:MULTISPECIES: hypothetical protein [Rhodococcus]OZC48688.1 hypothetical protein CH289_20160 [Rhodococcus sp. RS1C4]OZC85524.1 hypothetical protein CH282_13860 [Rhodococcus sp. 06-418-1B]OZD06797.1 hypothetical protein CH280_25955 [Rhodococcus sp. 06-156-4C]OZD20522.1 hypothetical protein CH253_14725 [Rhodococcus sp. 06-156-3C]OZD27595.1 hypothetical protein CH248_03600 [Rhodococcus sp. 06-156-4a]
MIRLVLAAGAAYVLGAKAGRGRYEQIRKTASAVAGSPATKKVIEVSRQKLSDSLNTQPKLEPMKPIDDETQLYIPQDQLRKR